MYYVYVLESVVDKEHYIGCSNDLKRRLLEHNHRQTQSIKLRAPFKLIYYEAFLSQTDAYNREKILKSKWGRKFLNRVLKNYYLNK